MFRLDPELDAAALAARFREAGRVRMAPFLDAADAAALHAHLRGRDDWRQVLNSGDKVFDLDRPTRATMGAEKAAALEAAVQAGARNGFQYRYEAIRVPDAPADRTGLLGDWAAFLSDGPARDLLRTVTGDPDIGFADAQATAYAPGDFLTGHDDAVAGKNRRAAYVLGLNPAWRIEWGGLLLFHDAPDRAEAWAPGFNSLSLFAVPQLHSVSAVAPCAPSRRYSVTGWLRSGANA